VNLVSLAILWMFGAFAIGGVVGFLIGKVTRFEVGLGTGLLVPGAVCLWFAAQCLIEYRAFLHAGPNGAWGEVTAIEDRAVNAAGDITQPVPVIRFTAPDQTVHTIYGPASGGMKVGDAVSVIYDTSAPERSRVGELSELRGGAIAMLLFGTFPASFGLWFIGAHARGREQEPTTRQARRTKPKEATRSVRVSKPEVVASTRFGKIVPGVLFLTMFGGTLWIGMGWGELELRFAQGFGTVALALFGYAIWGYASKRANAVWASGVATLGLNFGVWAYALYLLVG